MLRLSRTDQIRIYAAALADNSTLPTISIPLDDRYISDIRFTLSGTINIGTATTSAARNVARYFRAIRLAVDGDTRFDLPGDVCLSYNNLLARPYWQRTATAGTAGIYQINAIGSLPLLPRGISNPEDFYLPGTSRSKSITIDVSTGSLGDIHPGAIGSTNLKLEVYVTYSSESGNGSGIRKVPSHRMYSRWLPVSSVFAGGSVPVSWVAPKGDFTLHSALLVPLTTTATLVDAIPPAESVANMLGDCTVSKGKDVIFSGDRLDANLAHMVVYPELYMYMVSSETSLVAPGMQAMDLAFGLDHDGGPEELYRCPDLSDGTDLTISLPSVQPYPGSTANRVMALVRMVQIDRDALAINVANAEAGLL